MVQRTVDRFYPSYAEAVQVVADLTSSGISPANVSLIDSEADGRLPRDVATSSAQNPVMTGATLGAAIGGGIGALDGVGAITIPYAESLVATGWVLPCILFAVIFGIVGAVIGAIGKQASRNKQGLDAASRLQRGQQLVMVRADESELALVEGILSRSHTVPTAALATSEPAYDVAVPTIAHTVGDEVAPPVQTDDRLVRR